MINTTAVSSPIGSEVFSVVALLVISLGILLLLRHYLPLRTTPAYLLVPIFFALGLPASIILLVPIDLASSARNQDAGSRGIWLPDRVLLVSWRISYWLTFALTWYVCWSEMLVFTLIAMKVHSSYPRRIRRCWISRTKEPYDLLSALQRSVPGDNFWVRNTRVDILSSYNERFRTEEFESLGNGVGILLGFDAGYLSNGPWTRRNTETTIQKCEHKREVEEDTRKGAEGS